MKELSSFKNKTLIDITAQLCQVFCLPQSLVDKYTSEVTMLHDVVISSFVKVITSEKSKIENAALALLMVKYHHKDMYALAHMCENAAVSFKGNQAVHVMEFLIGAKQSSINTHSNFVNWFCYLDEKQSPIVAELIGCNKSHQLDDSNNDRFIVKFVFENSEKLFG